MLRQTADNTTLQLQVTRQQKEREDTLLPIDDVIRRLLLLGIRMENHSTYAILEVLILYRLADTRLYVEKQVCDILLRPLIRPLIGRNSQLPAQQLFN